MKKILLLTLLLSSFCLNALSSITIYPKNFYSGFCSANDENLLRVYRNPMNDFTRIEFCQSEKGNVKVEVMNATGTLLESIPKVFETTGLKFIELDTRLYRSGVYFVPVGDKMMQFMIG